MTRLEQALLAALKAHLQGLAALIPVLRQLAERYASLGSTARQTLERLLPELAALIAVMEGQGY